MNLEDEEASLMKNLGQPLLSKKENKGKSGDGGSREKTNNSTSFNYSNLARSFGSVCLHNHRSLSHCPFLVILQNWQFESSIV